jgi:hypothetical protein
VKTGIDKADAAVIADFGMEREHPRWQPLSVEDRRLRDLCRERLSMKKALSRARCQWHTMKHAHKK